MGAGEVRLPATWEEYAEIAGEVEFQIEYEDQHILFMSYATDLHERIVANILYILGGISETELDLVPFGSNRHVYLEEFECDYAPDASVLKGKSEDFVLRKGVTAYKNPYILFEVLSTSTASKDWNRKLPRYKKLPSVRQILYIEQSHPYVSIFNRIGDSDTWENTDYDKLEQIFSIEGKPITLANIYKRVVFDKQPNDEDE